MALQYSVAVRNARLDAIETTVSTAPLLQIRSGGQPANCAAASTGTLLVELTLPSNWMADAASGAKALAGTWSGVAVANGTAAHWRIFNAAGSTCHLQGSVTVSGGGGDMIASAVVLAISDTFDVISFTLTGGNA